MRQKQLLEIGMIFIFLVLTLSFVSSAMSSNPQYTQYMDVLTGGEVDESMCQQGGQDFLVQIAPFGCTPAIVRSDLLEEQNVPVFCQLKATKINSLIDIEGIDSISFSGEYPPEVEGIAFHPAQAALGVGEGTSSSLFSNIGYVVIVLKKQANASSMPDYVSGNLTAKIKYDVKNAFGIGKANFYLPEMSENEWEKEKYKYSFWNGKGSLRAEEVEADRAVIAVYSGDSKISSVSLEKGETSKKIYLPGFDCLASLQIKLNDLENPDTRALLSIDSSIVEVARGEKFLDNKCQVTSLEKQGLVQKVKIRCREDKGTNSFNLFISPKINLNINGKDREVELGERVYEDADGSRSVYLAYIGSKGDPRDVDNLFAVFISIPGQKNNLAESELVRYNTLVGKLLNAGATSSGIIDTSSDYVKKFAGLASIITRFIVAGERGHWLNQKDGAEDVFGTQVDLSGFAIPQDSAAVDDIDYYYDAVDDYETIVESFSGERYPEDREETLDEEALYNEITLAWYVGQKAIVLELCDEFKSLYPDSEKYIEEYCSNNYKLSNQKNSMNYVTINDESRQISLEGIYEPSEKEYSAEIVISNAGGDYNGKRVLQKNEKVYVSESEYFFLEELETDYAVFNIGGIEQTTISGDVKIESGDSEVIGKNKYEIDLTKINLEKSAKVSVIPGFDSAGAEASFGFKIGIEQRFFELAPDKIKSKIEKLNGQIGKWQNFSDKIGKVVKGLKTACFATGVGLTFKNLLANAGGGTGIARRYVMRGSGGWYEKCADLVNEGKYSTQEQCLNGESDNIDADVDELAEIIEGQNKEIKDLQKGFTETKLGGDVVDTDEFMKEYSEKVVSKVDDEDMKKILSYDGWENGNYDYEQLREIELWTDALENAESDELKKIARDERDSLFLEVKANADNYVQLSGWAKELGVDTSDIPFIELGDKMEKYDYKSGWTYGNLKTNLPANFPKMDDDTPLGFAYDSNGKKYILVLDDSVGGKNLPIKRGDISKDYAPLTINEETTTYTIKDALHIYDSNGNLLTENIPSEVKNVYFVKYDSSSYENPYKKVELNYYETEPYKGLPAIVPFDLNDGWYAATKQTLSVFGNIASYSESGAVNSFYLCNVGENGLEENIGGDDICQMINLGLGQPYDQFSGLSEKEAEKLAKCAEDAINDAADQYGKKTVKISTSCGGTINIKVGEPAVDIPEIQCTDLMSPKDCQLLFNVCDPVICPSSRCNFGGYYPVRDVIQSGIIGSLLLCFPNIQEGILMPICLTGVQAGIDGWLSVKTSYRDCLQNALDTGEMVGICDEIYSIYMCEFFWRQALPLADLAIPKIISALVGQNARGGGEYLTVASAWETAKDSVTYFTQYYGANSVSAFKARSTEEVGTEICKLSISAIYANGVDILDTLTEPDSPVQFHGRFDEIPFSSVTVPPTSHYKVFYHIYAGKDSGAYYQVYLKGLPESSYYQGVSSTLIIAAGYIETGGYATETVDRTAPSGYQQLCINVNGQEECGFQEVSTSFIVDYISDQYAESQAEKYITSESECVSDYDLGIVRVCATKNPGEGSDPYAGAEGSRWVEVGYCDENVKCWLDTDSLEEAIDFESVEEEALESVTENYLDILREEGYNMTGEEFASKLREINDENDNSKKLSLIEDIFDKAFLNREKAYLYLLRGNAYAELAKIAYNEYLAKIEKAKAEAEEAEEKSITKEEESGEETDGEEEPKEEPSSEEKTYKIDRIGFLIDEDTYWDKDALADENSVITVLVDDEDNCYKADYAVFLKERLIDDFFRNIWQAGTKGNYNEMISGGISLEYLNAELINSLSFGQYYVEGYCFYEEDKYNKIKSNILTIAESETQPSILMKYNDYKSLFQKYAEEYTPDGWSMIDFEALLVAIADRQSNLGYPNGDWIMEYGWKNGERISIYKGVETQIKSAAETLMLALNGDDSGTSYSGCNRNIKCVLSVYLVGGRGKDNWKVSEGGEYAQEVIDLWGFWKKCLQAVGTGKDIDLLCRRD